MSQPSVLLARLASVAVLLVTVVTLGLGGCGDDISGRVSCMSAESCGDPTDMSHPECCGGYCVAISPGCTSGYRYITSEPEFGECVETSMCPITADMTVTADMSKRVDGGK
jgi:hypothetical protein